MIRETVTCPQKIMEATRVATEARVGGAYAHATAAVLAVDGGLSGGDG